MSRIMKTALLTFAAALLVAVVAGSTSAQALKIGFVKDDVIQQNYKAWARAQSQLELDFKNVARMKVYVPMEDYNILDLDRVQGVSVWAIGDLRIVKFRQRRARDEIKEDEQSLGSGCSRGALPDGGDNRGVGPGFGRYIEGRRYRLSGGPL